MSHSPPVEDPVVVPVWIYNFAKYISQGKYIFAILCASALVIILFGLGIASYALIRYIDRRWPAPVLVGAYTPKTLDELCWVYGWSSPGSKASSGAERVIINLPAGPIFNLLYSQSSGEAIPQTVNNGDNAPIAEAERLSQIASTTSSTIVTVNYRLGNSPASPNELTINRNPYKYPTPIHDTLPGFDWVQKTLQPQRLGILGTHMGGSLALMLSLTEARSIQAVAAIDPICDWTSLDEHCIQQPPSSDADGHIISSSRRKGPRGGGTAPRDLVPLLTARKAFFSTPEKYSDAFASPLLFLRSPGKNVPRLFPEYLTGPEYPVPVLKARDSVSAEDDLIDYFWDVYLGEEDSMSEMSSNGETKRGPPRRRKAISRWPPFGLDYGNSGPAWHNPGHGIKRLEMELPWVRIFTQADDSVSESKAPVKSKNTKPSVLSQQAKEMIDVMRRSCFWGREKGYSESRVTLSLYPHDQQVDDARELAGLWLRGKMAD
ncbi:FAD binding domain family protein [Aspergillus niger]|uniref:FAD binding domain family protein n=1 Tax=Aspergillus niger TaxID=5061 RepID=A0A505HYV9_ASPNG|nr:FAD binding domain family protein [Aspergillus niger]